MFVSKCFSSCFLTQKCTLANTTSKCWTEKEECTEEKNIYIYSKIICPWAKALQPTAKQGNSKPRIWVQCEGQKSGYKILEIQTQQRWKSCSVKIQQTKKIPQHQILWILCTLHNLMVLLSCVSNITGKSHLSTISIKEITFGSNSPQIIICSPNSQNFSLTHVNKTFVTVQRRRHWFAAGILAHTVL